MLARRGARDLDDQARPLRDEPGDARPDGARERVRDAARSLRRADGDGHRARRLGRALHRPAADEGRRVRARVRDGQASFMNGGEVDWNDKQLQLKWVRPELPRIPMWVAGYGPKALGRRGPRRRRRDHPARRPRDHPVDHGHRARAPPRRRAATRASSSASSARRPHLRRPRRRARAGALVPGHGLEPRHGSDRALRHRRQRRAEGAHRLRPGAQVLRLQRPLARRREARRVRHRRDLRPLLRPRHGRAGEGEAAGARGDRRRPVQHLPHDPRAGGDAAGLRRRDHPRARRASGADSLSRAGSADAARAAAGVSAVVVERRLVAARRVATSRGRASSTGCRSRAASSSS